MIEAIKFRIRSCENRIAYWKNEPVESHLDNMMNSGIIIGLESELDSLNDLLKVAEKVKELEVSA